MNINEHEVFKNALKKYHDEHGHGEPVNHHEFYGRDGKEFIVLNGKGEILGVRKQLEEYEIVELADGEFELKESAEL